MKFKVGTGLSLLFALVAVGCATTRRPDDLVDVQKMIPGVVLDIRYATTNNFTGQQLYPFAGCYLRRAAAEKLAAVQAELQPLGYGLKIYDGYRPLSVQRKMWEVFPQPGYVADPKKGSRHNRGAAVDVTLIRLSDGTELPMPTPYDDFTEKTIVDSPTTSVARQALQSGVQIADAPSSLPAPMVVVPANAAPARHEAVRVAVLRSEEAGVLLTVRVLRTGEAAPPGSAEALLVGLEPAKPLVPG
jgi:D-alanyl-D-alanine dipeptidase